MLRAACNTPVCAARATATGLPPGALIVMLNTGVLVPLFKKLKAGDVLFIDSTHVARTGSDVNYIFFEILPALSPGVWIHFHDIMYPFEYPKEWVYEGRAWNEAYMLRAFLQYNSGYRIRFFNTWMHRFHGDIIGKKMQESLRNTGGSIWIEKLAAAS